MSQKVLELHLFQHELLDAFIRYFGEATQGMLGYSLVVEQTITSYGQEFAPPFSCIAQLDYTGSSVGFLALSGEYKTLETMFGMPAWSPIGRGILKELLNTASGHLLELLRAVCPVITLLSPKIIEGQVDYPKVSCLSRMIKTSYGDLYFAVVIDLRALEIDTVLKEALETKERLLLTQKELVQAEKMASLGELVAGVAHEVNTPLGVGITASSHLSEQMSAMSQKFIDEKMKRSDLHNFFKNGTEEAKLIYDNLMRASRLIQSFKKVAVDHSSEELRLFSIVPYIREVISSLVHLTRDGGIAVAIEGDEELLILSYPGVFSQMVAHFLSNAVHHAFEGRQGGRILISIEYSQGELTLRFKDNGAGMKPEVCKKVFDPFFTTKRGRGGTGLGLHIIYNSVVQRLGGKLRCSSEENAGTEFVVNCPMKTSSSS